MKSTAAKHDSYPSNFREQAFIKYTNILYKIKADGGKEIDTTSSLTLLKYNLMKNTR